MFTTLTPSAANTASRLPTYFGIYFGIPIADEERDLGGPLNERHGEVARLLAHPLSGRVSGHPAKPHHATLELNEEQHVHPGECDRLDREEVARQHAGSLGSKELGPGRTAPPRGRAPSHCGAGYCAPKCLTTTFIPSLAHSPQIRR